MDYRTFSQTIASLLIAVILSMSVDPSKGHAEEIVSFMSTPTPISPFKLKRSKIMGVIPNPTPGIKLKATLFYPESHTPRPAVIILVGKNGLQQSHLDWGASMAQWGYVGLVIDSFGSRGGSDYRDTPTTNMSADAVSAAAYLQSLDQVDGQKIALLGFSIGASRVISMLYRDNPNHPAKFLFKAGISFYPTCASNKYLRGPLLLFAGEADQLMTLISCKKIFREAKQFGNDISAYFYPGATHFFDNPGYRKDIISPATQAKPPLWFELSHYAPAAHDDAVLKVRLFLKKHLAR